MCKTDSANAASLERDGCKNTQKHAKTGMADPQRILSHINADTGTREHAEIAEMYDKIVSVGSDPGTPPPRVGRPRALPSGAWAPLLALSCCGATCAGVPIQNPSKREKEPKWLPHLSLKRWGALLAL